jgi:ATP phosphoribosyltransferase
MNDVLTIALPKGKLLKKSCELLNAAGIPCGDITSDSRQLTFTLPEAGVRLLICRASDVPTYVEYGAADVGLVGKDTIVEQGKDVAELLDLHFGTCRFALAIPAESVPPQNADGTYELKQFNRKRVATKFPRVAQSFFAEQGMQVQVIQLHGNIELAPKVGLAEVIVDIVSTGATLKENNLVEIATIFTATTRLIANRVSWRLHYERIQGLVNTLRGLTTSKV